MTSSMDPAYFADSGETIVIGLASRAADDFHCMLGEKMCCLFFFFETEFRSYYPGRSAMARSRLTANSASQVKVIPQSQSPE